MADTNRKSRKRVSNKKKGGWQIDSYMRNSKNIPINYNTRTRNSQKRQTIRQNRFLKLSRKNNLLA
jgi:hypothetical protein